MLRAIEILSPTKICCFLSGAAWIIFPFSNVSAEDLIRARNLAATCSSCHSNDGSGRGAIPSLAGQEKNSLLEKIRAFSTGERSSTIMHQLIKGYSEEELGLIATYLANQKS